ncbi:MAG: hypothetical protein HQM09_18640 [Candidatus Riflebacteria bacterium]|nr:hypothetical protein [Candidatus Riflebacteria bacterium]
MECSRLTDRLDSVPPLSLQQISEEFRDHIRECPSCARSLEALRKFSQEAVSINISQSEARQMLERIEHSIVSEAPSAPARSLNDVVSFPFDFLQILKPALRIVFAGIIFFAISLSLFGPKRLVTPESSIFLTGNDAVAEIAPGNTLLAGTDKQSVFTDTTVMFRHGNSHGTLVFPDNGAIEFHGKGVIKVTSDGFTTSDASFVASFKRGKKGFTVKVPQAILGIRGTSIQFDLVNGNGSIRLLSGVVEVTPSSPRAVSFTWNPGEKITLDSNGLKRETKTSIGTSSVQPAPAATTTPTTPGLPDKTNSLFKTGPQEASSSSNVFDNR